MKNKKTFIKNAFIIAIIVLVFIGVVVALNMMIFAQVENGFIIQGELMECSGEKIPEENNVSKITKYSTGNTSIGTLVARGCATETTWNGYHALALLGDKIEFEYIPVGNHYVDESHKWVQEPISGGETGKLLSNLYQPIDGDDVLVIYKSLDGGKNWSLVAISGIIGNEHVSFIPDGDDLSKGVIYRFVSYTKASYQYVSGTHTEGILWWKKTIEDFSTQYVTMAQIETVYVASDNTQIGFYSSEVWNQDKSGISMAIGDAEMFNKGFTLTNGSVSTSYIRVDMLGKQSISICCSFNGGQYFDVKDGDIYTECGEYEFITTTSFNTTSKVTLYISNFKNDLGYSQYFGNGFILQDKRLFSSDSVLPVYYVGTSLQFTIPEHYPSIYGEIIRYNDGAMNIDDFDVEYTFNGDSKKFNVQLSTPGIYYAELYIGNPNASGTIVKYSFHWVISDKLVKPAINYQLLTSVNRAINVSNTCYVVAFPTAGGGSYLFCFPNTEKGRKQALELSENAEKRFVEDYGSYYYYKSSDFESSGLKTKYTSKKGLYEAIESFASQNVNLIHFDNSDEYAVIKLEELINNVENTSIRSDIRVCSSEAVRQELLVSGYPMVNGFSFTQVCDYEVSKVTIYDNYGKEYSVPFDMKADEFLKNTGIYTVIEDNWCGSKKYEVVYIAPNDNSALINLTTVKGNVSQCVEFNQSHKGIVISAEKFVINSITDKFDSETILRIEFNGVSSLYSINNIHDYELSNNGLYLLEIINRLGYKYSLQLYVEKPVEETTVIDETTTINETGMIDETIIINETSVNVEETTKIEQSLTPMNTAPEESSCAEERVMDENNFILRVENAAEQLASDYGCLSTLKSASITFIIVILGVLLIVLKKRG